MPGTPNPAHEWRLEEFGGGLDTPVVVASGDAAKREVPVYDKDRRELWFKGELVKRLRQPAKNVERVLLEFEEFGWPPSIEDPLPGPAHAQVDRLHDALRRLNDQRGEVRIRFFRNGNGTTILWEVLE